MGTPFQKVDHQLDRCPWEDVTDCLTLSGLSQIPHFLSLNAIDYRPKRRRVDYELSLETPQEA